MKIHSWNEWDPLKSVIIGRANGAQVPKTDTSLWAINYADKYPNYEIPNGPYPEQVIVEANEDLENLTSELEKLNVKVYRPEDLDFTKSVSNGDWSADGYYGYCPRDSVLVYGDMIIESPMPLRARFLETQMFRDIFLEAMNDGAKWFSSPKPGLSEDCYDLENISKDKLTLKEVEPSFDAANVLRCGRDLFYLVSNSGNKLGGKWLQNILGKEFKIHFLEGIYSYMHLDSTISFIRPGLVLLNPSRINEDNIPEALKSWDKIWCADPVDIGFHEPYCNASVWVGMNLLMVNPNLAVVEKNQTELIKQLESFGVDVLALDVRHARTLGGGFHCVTLDLEREGKLEDYF